MVLLFAYLALAATALAQTEGNVTIMVVDPEGAAMPFMVGQTRTDISSHFDGLRGTHIPYGTYLLDLVRTPLNSLNEAIPTRIDVKQPDALYVVIVPKILFRSGIVGDGQLRANYYEVRGQIEPFEGPVSEPMWIRLVPILASGPTLDVEVNSSGEFHIYQVLSGKYAIVGRYLALIIRGGKIIDTQEITFELSPAGLQRIVLKLSNHPPSLGPRPEAIPK
jgi:hypothetical protein